MFTYLNQRCPPHPPPHQHYLNTVYCVVSTHFIRSTLSNQFPKFMLWHDLIYNVVSTHFITSTLGNQFPKFMLWHDLIYNVVSTHFIRSSLGNQFPKFMLWHDLIYNVVSTHFIRSSLGNQFPKFMLWHNSLPCLLDILAQTFKLKHDKKCFWYVYIIVSQDKWIGVQKKKHLKLSSGFVFIDLFVLFLKHKFSK